MTGTETLSLRGKSGTSYKFEVHRLGTSFRPVGGVYAITKRSSGGQHQVVYIGQTGDLSERFDNHHRAACFTRHGATHIGVHQESSETRRFAIETDLIRNYDPPCNRT